jgi:hypothetical protein
MCVKLTLQRRAKTAKPSAKEAALAKPELGFAGAAF